MGKKILIIDDDADLSKEIADLLIDEGHQVDVCLSVPSDLSQLKLLDYHVLLLDFKMQGITGADVLKHLPDPHSFPKVFVLSGRPFVEKALKDAQQWAKVTEVIPKPFLIQELLQKINSL